MSKFGVTDRFAFLVVFVFYLTTITVGFFYHSETIENEMNLKEESKLLNHIVLIKFKENLSYVDLQLITDAGYALQQIKEVLDLNFTKNVSPEGLNHGFSHSLTMKFLTAEDRDSIYLPNPIHKKFVKLFVPFTESVLVYDYWD
tara:strand:+ start:126 stop:557 length:432 start_codon:yes stop_codon:yes gene_type:complete